jgi:hypothetical protein
VSLRAFPITLDEANAYVRRIHRHAPQRMIACRFATAAVSDDGLIRGVVIAGNPKARALDGAWELEVNRVCTEGYRNACSFLYGRARWYGRAAGYCLLYTYTTSDEDGASLKASGWTFEAETDGRDWAKERGPGRTAKGGPRGRWTIRLANPLPVSVRWPEELQAERPDTLFQADVVA